MSALLASTSEHSDHHSGVLAIAREHTKGMNHLPCTRQELDPLEEHARATRCLQLEETVDEVLNAVDQYSWIHLACHASQHAQNPTQSAFHLHDGDLTLSTITRRSFKTKDLVFLSTCQMAAGSKELPDEVLHLAAEMLMAGYPSVIATMWAIQDENALKVAGNVYAD